MDNRQTEVKVLSCILHQDKVRELLRRREAGIKIDYFLDPHVRRITTSALTYLKRYGDLPPTRIDYIRQIKRDNPKLTISEIESLDTLLTEIYKDTDPGHFEFHRDQLRDNWLQHRARRGLDACLGPLSKKNFSGFSDVLTKLIRDLSVEVESDLVQIDVFQRHFEQVIADLEAARAAGPQEGEAITTGLPWVDQKLGGGHYRGENYLYFGYSGRGKSFLGTQFGYAAAAAGHKVVKFSLEMRARKDLARFESRLTSIPYPLLLRKPWLIDDEQWRHFTTLMKQWRERAYIYDIRSFERRPTMNGIRAALHSLAYEPDLVIIDQLTDVAGSLEWKDIALAAADMQLLAKSWQQERGLAVVTFGQAKGSSQFDSHPTQDDFKYGRAPTEWCTAVGYLSQTKEDKEDNLIRLGYCKDRDGEETSEQMILYPNRKFGRIHCFDREAQETSPLDETKNDVLEGIF